MLRYILSRLVQTIPVLVIVALLIFIIARLAPGDPAAILLGPDASADEIEALREQLGFNRPVYEQFFNWVGGLFVGNLGYSLFLQESVASAIGSHLLPTISLAVFAQLLAVVVAIPAGIAAARRPGGPVDRLLMGMSLLGISVPSFLLGLFLALLFAVVLRWLPVAGYADPGAGFGPFLLYLVLPAIALAAMQAALLARMTRSTMMDVLTTNYVTTARAKGVSGGIVLYKHAFRTAVNPILTVVGQSFGVLITGAVVIETVFNIPGLGQLIVLAIQRRDFDLIQGVVLVATLMYLVLNLIVDLLYGVFDPRIRLRKAG
ncbi:MAG: ABC transporter permease [Rhodoglobus sp.]